MKKILGAGAGQKWTGSATLLLERPLFCFWPLSLPSVSVNDIFRDLYEIILKNSLPPATFAKPLTNKKEKNDDDESPTISAVPGMFGRRQ